MKEDMVATWFDKWKTVIVAVFMLGLIWGTLQASLSSKASKDDVAEMQADLKLLRIEIRLMREQQENMNSRMTAFFCLNQPVWCR